MQFAQPLWLLAGLISCAALVWQYRRFDSRQQIALTQFASARLLEKLTSSVSATRRLVKRLLLVLGTALLFAALARPQAGFEFQETHRKGLELLFAVDTSKSMLAQDVKPDRLSRAKLAVTDLVTKLNGDGVGLIAFAGNAFLQCPVTLDYDAFRESLDALDVNVIPRGGTNIASAIHEAEAVFKTRSATDKILVLITDGEDLDGAAISAAEAAAKGGMKIFTVGVGSATGELVPIPSETGGTDFARDENGQPVRSHLDEATLKKIAEATGGIYQPLGGQGEGLTAIYEQGLSSFARRDLSSREAKVPLEKFHWALLAALACFIAEILIGNRRKIPGTKLRPATVAAVLLVLIGVGGTQAASPQVAEQAYQKGDFVKAQQEYAATAEKDPAKAELQFNTGSAAYKAGDYAKAGDAFRNSLKTEQVPVQQGAYYNLGNTQYRLGEKTAQQNPQETIKTWEEAVKSYDAALQIKPDDAESKHNRELVKRKIDELKKQEEQKKQDQQKQQDQKEQQQKQDQQNDSKDQKDSKNQQGESKDAQDQKGDSKEKKDRESGSGEQKNDSKDSEGGDDQKKADESKDQNDGGDKGKQDQPMDDHGKGENRDEKDRKSEAKAQTAGDKKDDQEKPSAEAKSGKGEQPKPVDPAKKPFKGDATAANGEKPGNSEAVSAAEERREPGQLTKEEAKQLLDALKNDERPAPAISQQGQGAGQPDDKKISKDW